MKTKPIFFKGRTKDNRLRQPFLKDCQIAQKLLLLAICSCFLSVTLQQSCSSGQFLNDSGSCQTCPKGCKTCSSLVKCLSCDDGFGFGLSDKETCQKCSQDNCKSCENFSCTSCFQGYNLKKDECVYKWGDRKVLIGIAIVLCIICVATLIMWVLLAKSLKKSNIRNKKYRDYIEAQDREIVGSRDTFDRLSAAQPNEEPGQGHNRQIELA